MNDLKQIQNLIITSKIWNLTFLSIGLLGIYFSIILLGFNKNKNQKELFLGLYSFTISILLIYFTSLVYPFEHIYVVLEYTSSGLIYLAGPFSYLIYYRRYINHNNYIYLIHIIPAIAVFLFSWIFQIELFWLNIGGILHIGGYLFFQSILVFNTDKVLVSDFIENAKISNRWSKNITKLQIILHIVICVICITANTIDIYFCISILLSILILAIWIGLLHSAHYTYLK